MMAKVTGPADPRDENRATPVGTRRVAVVTNLRCNQACTYCDRRAATDDLRFISAPEVGRRVRAAIADGATEILFTGGEPTVRSDLESLAKEAVAAGARGVGIETNGTLIDDARAPRLREAGLVLARVNLARWGRELNQ